MSFQGYMLSARGISHLDYPDSWEKTFNGKSRIWIEGQSIKLNKGDIIGSPSGITYPRLEEGSAHLDRATFLTGSYAQELVKDVDFSP